MLFRVPLLKIPTEDTFVKMIEVFGISSFTDIVHLTMKYHEYVLSPRCVRFAPWLINYQKELAVETEPNQWTLHKLRFLL